MSVTISTKVPEELADRIDEAREEGENTSACVRRLVRSGLEDAENAGKTVLTGRIYLLWFGSLFILAPNTEPASMPGTTMMGLGAVLVIGAALFPYARQKL